MKRTLRARCQQVAPCLDELPHRPLEVGLPSKIRGVPYVLTPPAFHRISLLHLHTLHLSGSTQSRRRQAYRFKTCSVSCLTPQTLSKAWPLPGLVSSHPAAEAGLCYMIACAFDSPRGLCPHHNSVRCGRRESATLTAGWEESRLAPWRAHPLPLIWLIRFTLLLVNCDHRNLFIMIGRCSMRITAAAAFGALVRVVQGCLDRRKHTRP